MTVLDKYEFRRLDRLHSICIISKDDIITLLNFKELKRFSLNYPAYIYMHCHIETFNVYHNSELNMPGCWISSDEELILRLMKFFDSIFESYLLLDFSDIYIYSIDSKIKKN